MSIFDASPINVIVANDTSVEISTIKLYHLPGQPDLSDWIAGSYTPFCTINNLTSGERSSPISVSSESTPGDYWFGTVIFANDPQQTPYFICGEISVDGLFPPYKECNIPSGGSARISIQMQGGNNVNAGYIYAYNNNDETDDDGGANFNLMDAQSVVMGALIMAGIHAV